MGWIIAETLAVCFFIVLGLAGFTVYNLKSGPVDITFASKYLQDALRQGDGGIYATMDHAELHWPDLKGPLLLQLKGGRVISGLGKEIVFVNEIDLALSKSKLLIGKIEPVSLIIDNPSLRIIRSEENDISFGLGTPEAIVDEKIVEQADDQKNLITTILALIENSDDPKAVRSPLSSLRRLEINGAQVMVEDHYLGASWFIPDFNIAFDKARKGLGASFDIGFPAVGEEESYLRAQVLLDRATGDMQMAAELHNFDASIIAGKIEALDMLAGQGIVLNGQVDASMEDDFTIRALDAELTSAEGIIDHEEIFSGPVPYSAFEALLHYSNNEGAEILHIENFQIALGGMKLQASAEMNGHQSHDEILGGEIFSINGYKGPFKIAIDDMPHSAIKPIWPVFLKGDSSEKWILERISGGSLSNLSATGDLIAFKQDSDWDIDVENFIAGFNVADVAVDYRNPLPPVTKGYGAGIFDMDADTLSIKVEKAELGGMQVHEADLIFKDVVAEGKGDIALDIKMDGPLKNVFEYISIEPIDLKDELDMDISKVKGQADLHVKLDFPTRNDLLVEEINMDIKGKVTEGFLPDILEGLPLSGGPFDVVVNNEFYSVTGSGKLDDRDVTLDWKEYLNSEGKDFRHQAKAKISVDERMRNHFGIDLSDFIEGDLNADIVYTGLHGNKAEAKVAVDMTPAKFFVEPFKYVKPAGAAGQANLTAKLENNELKSIVELSGTAPQLVLEETSLSFKQADHQTELSKVDISRVIIGETVSALDINIASSGAMQIVMKGEFLDLRPFLANDGSDDGAVTPPIPENPATEKPASTVKSPPMTIAVAVDQMRTADGQSVQYAKIYADIDDQGRFNQLELDATAGKGDIYLRFKPDSRGVRTFRLEAEDAGATLKAFDVYKNIVGGKLVIYGEPIKGIFDRNIKGLAEITNFRVVQAPSLARLIGALSLPGVIQLLNNDGLDFEKLEANFDWVYRQQGSLLVLKDGRTSGNSLGLTFDGVFDNAAQTVDVSGTIIPLSGMNNIIGSIPLVGDILTGGTGALFAATYTVRGDFEDPKTSVNPLSVLTPGILRRVLFE